VDTTYAFICSPSRLLLIDIDMTAYVTSVCGYERITALTTNGTLLEVTLTGTSNVAEPSATADVMATAIVPSQGGVVTVAATGRGGVATVAATGRRGVATIVPTAAAATAVIANGHQAPHAGTKRMSFETGVLAFGLLASFLLV
jgi:hypothetical protein